MFKGNVLATEGQTLRKTEMLAGFSPCWRCDIVIMRSLGTHNCTSVFILYSKNAVMCFAFECNSFVFRKNVKTFASV